MIGLNDYFEFEKFKKREKMKRLLAIYRSAVTSAFRMSGKLNNLKLDLSISIEESPAFSITVLTQDHANQTLTIYLFYDLDKAEEKVKALLREVRKDKESILSEFDFRL